MDISKYTVRRNTSRSFQFPCSFKRKTYVKDHLLFGYYLLTNRTAWADVHWISCATVLCPGAICRRRAVATMMDKRPRPTSKRTVTWNTSIITRSIIFTSWILMCIQIIIPTFWTLEWQRDHLHGLTSAFWQGDMPWGIETGVISSAPWRARLLNKCNGNCWPNTLFLNN